MLEHMVPDEQLRKGLTINHFDLVNSQKALNFSQKNKLEWLENKIECAAEHNDYLEDSIDFYCRWIYFLILMLILMTMSNHEGG